jgi:signal transduction histidine kinase
MLNDSMALQPFREVVVEEVWKLTQGIVRNHEVLFRDVRVEEQLVGKERFGRKFKGDPDLIEQAVWELIANACRYSDGTEPIVVGIAVTDETMTISVRDHGVELREADKENCKEDGWRSPEAIAVTGEGSGVGLSIVDDIMRAHNGKLLVKATDERGFTLFGLSIPLLVEGVHHELSVAGRG